MKSFFTILFLLFSTFSFSQLPDPVTFELEIQQYEISDINNRLNKSLTLISDAGRQKNLALAIGVGGGLVSTLMMVKGKTESTRNAGLVIGGITLVGTLYLTINSNEKLREVESLKL